MRVKVVAIALLLVLLITGTASASIWDYQHSLRPSHEALTTDQLTDQELRDKVFGDWEEDRKGNVLSRHFAAFLSDIATGLYWALGIQDPVTLIYGVNPDNLITNPQSNEYTDPQNLILYTFKDAEATVIRVFYGAMERFLLIPLLIAVIIFGYFVLIKNLSTEHLTTGKEYLLGLLLFVLLILFGGIIVEPLFFINRAIVLFVGSQAAPIVSLPIFEAFLKPFDGVLPLYWVVLFLLLFFGTAVLNFQYTVRKITLAVLLIMFPWVAYRAIFPSGRGALGQWFREFCSNLFLQSAHALLYAVMLTFFAATYNYLVLIAMVVSLSTLTNLVRGMFGASGSEGGMGGAMAGMMGLTAMMGIGGIFSRIKGGTASSAARTVAEKGGDVAGIGSAAGAMDGTAEAASRSATIAASKPILQKGLMKGMKWKTGLTHTAMGLGAVTGALALGAAMGPAGISLGVKMGLGTGQVAGSAVGGVAMGAGSVVDTHKEISALAEDQDVTYWDAVKGHFGIAHGDQWLDSESAGELGRRMGSSAGWVGAKAGAGIGRLYSTGLKIKTGNWGFQQEANEFRARTEKDHIIANRRYADTLNEVQERKPLHDAQISQYGPGTQAWNDLQSRAASAQNQFVHAKNDLAMTQDRHRTISQISYSPDNEEYAKRAYDTAAKSLESFADRGEAPPAARIHELNSLRISHENLVAAKPENFKQLHQSLQNKQAVFRQAEVRLHEARTQAQQGPVEYQVAQKALAQDENIMSTHKAQLIEAQLAQEKQHELISRKTAGYDKPRVFGGFSSAYAADSIGS